MNGYEAAKAALHTPGLSPTEKLVLIALADHTNETGECWPSLSRLSQVTGLGRSSVLRSIVALEAAGVIARTRQTGSQNRYRLNLNQYHSDTSTSTTVTPGSTTVEPQPVPQWNGGSTTVTPEQNNNKPSEKTNEQNGMYARDDAMPRYEAQDPERQRYITAISAVVKDTFWDKSRAAFESAAEALARDGVAVEQIAAFTAWWAANRFYPGKPSLTSLLQEIQNSIAGVKKGVQPSPNGQHKRFNPDFDDIPEREGGVF